jgi:cytochrome P450
MHASPLVVSLPCESNSCLPFEHRPVLLGGYRLPRGAIVILSQYVTHRDPRFYVEPERFDPGRWMPDVQTVSRFAFFPFGGGPRVCIGEHFAWLGGVMLLATIAQLWRIATLHSRLNSRTPTSLQNCFPTPGS